MKSASDSPRILYVAEACAFNVANGSNVRCLNVVRALEQVGRVEVVTLSDPTDVVQLPKANPEIHFAYPLGTLNRPNKGLFRKLQWTFDAGTDYPRGYGVSDEGLRQIYRSAKEFDLIWFFKHRCEGLFPNRVWPHSVLDIDDVLSTYERAALKNGNGPLERLLTLRRMVSWRRRERLLGTRFSVLSVCSPEDKQYLRGLGVHAPIHIIPNGFEKPLQKPVRQPATPPRIGFIGLLNYLPNQHGLRWFVESCWPLIKREIPEARLRLVGSGSDGPLKPRGADIDALGWVADPTGEMATWSAMAVPIRIGAGTRVKIAHGFSQKCPIVSTSTGAYGYGAIDGRELYLADSAEAFARACIKTIREPEQAAELAERAWHVFSEKWTWEAVRPKIWAAVEDCLRLERRSSSQLLAHSVPTEGVPENKSV
jgi:glycosyltransferase involved in cell wall biosynthesis